MNITRISNLLLSLVEHSEHWQSFHFGYHSDINANIASVQNAYGNTGRLYPLVLLAAPLEGELLQDEKNKQLYDEVQIELYFYDLQDRDNGSDSDGKTLCAAWNELKGRGIEFYHALRDLSERTENRARWLRVGRNVKWFTDSNLHVDRLLMFGIQFSISLPYTCADYEVQNPPLSECLSGDVDCLNDNLYA